MTQCPNCNKKLEKGFLNRRKTIERVGNNLVTNFQRLSTNTAKILEKTWLMALQCTKCQIVIVIHPIRKNIIPTIQRAPETEIKTTSNIHS